MQALEVLVLTFSEILLGQLTNVHEETYSEALFIWYGYKIYGDPNYSDKNMAMQPKSNQHDGITFDHSFTTKVSKLELYLHKGRLHRDEHVLLIRRLALPKPRFG